MPSTEKLAVVAMPARRRAERVHRLKQPVITPRADSCNPHEPGPDKPPPDDPPWRQARNGD